MKNKKNLNNRYILSSLLENNRGATNIYIALGVLLAIFSIVSVFYVPLINRYHSIIRTTELITPYVSERNALERLYSEFYENMSFNESLVYDDLGKTYEIIEKQVTTRKVNHNLTSGGTKNFTILNKTDVVINIGFLPFENLNPGVESYYSFDITFNGKTVIKDVVKNKVKNDTQIIIPETFIYDETTGNFNYGNYVLNISTVNAYVDVDIEYYEQSYREVDIIDEKGSIKTLILKNNTSVGGTIERNLK